MCAFLSFRFFSCRFIKAGPHPEQARLTDNLPHRKFDSNCNQGNLTGSESVKYNDKSL